MHAPLHPGLRTHPVGVWFVVLGLIALAEYAVMVILPWLLPAQAPRILESVVDSMVLAVIVAPALWWMIVRPLRQAMSLQMRFLSHSLAAIEAERRHRA
jgi:hypothetical protein